MFTTKKSLLKRLRNNDDISWNEFYLFYWPFVRSIGERLGLMPEDCKDLMQEIMIALFNGKEILRYDASKGKFRAYFGLIVRRKVFKMLRNAARFPQSPVPIPDAPDADIPGTMDTPELQNGNDPFQKIFDEEYNQYLLSLALNELRGRVQPSTYDIFEMVVIQKRPAKEVARYLGIDRNVIDKYCSRCRKNLQKIISEIRTETPEFNPELPE